MTARPLHLTPEMKKAAALKLAADVKRHCFDFKDEDINELAEQIAANVRSEYDDGYELARRLDDLCGWSPDPMMVEVLDNWSRYAGAVLREANP